MISEKFSNKKYVVYGMGLSGRSAYKLLKTKGCSVSAISKGDPATWRAGLEGEENNFIEESSDEATKILNDSDCVILSPGIPREHSLIKNHKGQDTEIISEIELAYRFLDDPKIIAVTGSNGKTTTVSLIGEILKSSGARVFIGGNIGRPFCEACLTDAYDFYLLELSSFQLESLKNFRAQIAVILNVEMTHEERYSSYEKYLNAKLNILNNQNKSDTFFINSNLKNDVLKKFPHLNGEFLLGSLEILNNYDLEKFKLPGAHNKENLIFSINVALKLGVKEKIIQKVIDSFTGVPYRIQYEGRAANKTYYNDSKSTNLFSTKKAIETFCSQKITLLLGGQVRDTEALNLHEIENISNQVEQLIIFGDLAIKLKQSAVSGNITLIPKLKDLNITDVSSNSEIILFSPGFPSFDEFKNYQERGELFHQFCRMNLIK